MAYNSLIFLDAQHSPRVFTTIYYPQISASEWKFIKQSDILTSVFQIFCDVEKKESKKLE
jgi:hypothetical protein